MTVPPFHTPSFHVTHQTDPRVVSRNDGNIPPLYNRGVRVDWLLQWTDEHHAWHLATWEVVERNIKRETENRKCRYVELLDTKEEARVIGASDVFVSHAWGGNWGDLVAAVASVMQPWQRVWIDIFAVKQWEKNEDDLDFGLVIEKSHALLLVISPDSEVARLDAFQLFSGQLDLTLAQSKSVPFRRIWCIYEIAIAAAHHKPVVLRAGKRGPSSGTQPVAFDANFELAFKLHWLVNAEKAVATFPEDKERILSDIRSSFGGLREVNNAVSNACLCMLMLNGEFSEVESWLCGHRAPLTSLDHNVVRQEDQTPLLLAVAAAGATEAIHLLVNRGADVNSCDKFGRTALMRSARGGNASCVRVLLDLGADPNRKTRKRRTALMEAAEGGNLEIIHLLAGAGAALDDADAEGLTGMLRAAMGGHTEAMLEILDMGAALESVDVKGRSALLLSSLGGHVDTVRKLLKLGRDADGIDNEGKTAAMYAAGAGHVEVLKALVQSGMDIKKKDNFGQTVESLGKKHSAVSKYLKQHTREQGEEETDVVDGDGIYEYLDFLKYQITS
ncbi:hypothetical protein CYMTET_13056 [Cymbomonas tetramitiformis]|uniref:Uncharacterized protein n=1 Tax=Cymbomonas tetramitiformis TaxID=36881 RepID=A0AAE0GJ70_9CHLO|nr:hypothetical protein CYMTET_13056 [Cymbomonas tetramitiformis]